MRNVRSTGARTSSYVESQFKQLGVRLAQAVAVAIPAIGGLAIRQAAEFQDLRVALDTLNRSAAEGARNFERLVQFSSQTPFQLKELTRAQNTLQGFGLSADEAFESLRNIGDIAAVSSGDIQGIGIAFGQAAAEGKLMTRDIRQLINQGVPAINLLANTMGVARNEVLDLAEQGEISFEILQQAFRDATREGGLFEDGMLRAQQTISGAFSNLRDNTNILLASIGDLISDASDLEQNVRGLSTWFGNAAQEGSEFSDVLLGLSTVMERLSAQSSRLRNLPQLLQDISTGGLTALGRKLGDEVIDKLQQIGEETRNVDALGVALADLFDQQNQPLIFRQEDVNIVDEMLNHFGELPSAIDSINFDNINEFKRSLDRVEESASNVVDVTDQLSRFLSDTNAQIDITANLPEPGTIGAIEQQMAFLRDRMQEVSSAAEFAPLNAEMERLQERLNAIRGETENITPEFNKFGREAAQIFDRLIFQGERFGSILKSILRQLATRQLAKFLGGAIGLGGGGFLGGIFGSVGVGSVAPQASSQAMAVTVNVKGESEIQGSTLKTIFDQTETDIARLT